MRTAGFLLAVLVFSSGCGEAAEPCGSSGCGEAAEPCGHGAAPSFRAEGLAGEVEGRVRFPAGGEVRVGVEMHVADPAEFGAGSVSLVGPFESSVETNWHFDEADQRTLRIVSGEAGRGRLVARDACGRTAALDLEAVPAAAFHLSTDVEAAVAALPAEHTAAGWALLPGTHFHVHVAPLDEAGEPLAGMIFGSLGGDGGWMYSGGRRDFLVRVTKGGAPLTIRFEDGPPLVLATAAADEVERIALLRGGEGLEVGAPLELAVGEIAELAAHGIDVAGRLLVGPLDGGNPQLGEDAAGVVGVLGAGSDVGTFWLSALAPGEARLRVVKGGVETELQVRVAAR